MTVRVPSRVACEACAGTGAEARAPRPTTCPTCRGAGKVRAQQGFFLSSGPARPAAARGRIIKQPLPVCHGAGPVQRERTLKSRSRPGVEDGTRIRLAGEGEAGWRRAVGRSLLFVGIKPHPIFQRDGANIFAASRCAMTQAALGGEVEVPTIDGGRGAGDHPGGHPVRRPVPPAGQGLLRAAQRGRGDMFIQVSVETPQNLSPRQRELLSSSTEAGKGGRTSPEAEGFFAKVAAFWDGLGR